MITFMRPFIGVTAGVKGTRNIIFCRQHIAIEQV